MELQQLTLMFLHLIIVVCGFDFALKPPTSCVMERTKRMLAYNCINLRLKEVPQYMKSTVEIIWLTDNRIRELYHDSLAKYGDLRYLYINENMVQTVEEGAFAQLTGLEVLDLSSNALTTIPNEIFQLPLLRTLYAADNNLHQLEAELKALHRPIAAPLQIISFSACKLHTIPDLGILPNLLHANFSLNPMSRIDQVQLAPMCHLKSLDLSRAMMPGCSCQSVLRHLDAMSVYVKNGPIYCDIPASGCPEDPSTNATRQVLNQCLATKAEQVRSSMVLYCGVGAAAFGVFVVLCGCCCYRNRKIARRKRELKKAAAERRARKRKAAAEKRLMDSSRDSAVVPSDSEKEGGGKEPAKSSLHSRQVQVDVEKVPASVY